MNKLLDRWGDHSAVAAKKAVILTRPKKKQVEKAPLEARWKETARAYGLTEDNLKRLLGREIPKQTSTEEFKAKLLSKVERLPARRRTREALLKLIERLAIERNIDGNTKIGRASC